MQTNFQRLAAVELQLIMHCCDKRTLLALARCCRFALSAASSDFAWRGTSPVAVGFSLATAAAESTPELVWQWLLRSLSFLPSAAAPSPLPLGALIGQSLLRHADLLVRWADEPKGDEEISEALRLIGSLPRLGALDLSDRRLASVWAAPPALLQPLGTLTALDASGTPLVTAAMRVLAQQLPRLRTLHCYPSGWARECLLPLLELPLLSDLRLEGWLLQGPAADSAVLAECRGLRRLALSGRSLSRFAALLRAPGLRSLPELTLAHFVWDDSWAAIFANLHSLRRLTVDRCACAAPLLSALQLPAVCPQLRRLRIAPEQFSQLRPWSNTFNTRRNPRALPPRVLTALLEQRPGVAVELRLAFERAGVAASWLLPPPSEGDWLATVPQWTNFEPLHPLRHRYRRMAVLFADEELGCAAPLLDLEE